MIYVKASYSRRDPISVGMQNTFLPVYDLTEPMVKALRRIDAAERRARLAAPQRGGRRPARSMVVA